MLETIRDCSEWLKRVGGIITYLAGLRIVSRCCQLMLATPHQEDIRSQCTYYESSSSTTLEGLLDLTNPSAGGVIPSRFMRTCEPVVAPGLRVKLTVIACAAVPTAGPLLL